MHQIREIEVGSDSYLAAVELRLRELRRPLGLSFSEDDLAQEIGQTHVGAFVDGELVGCLVLVPLDAQTVKMRQVVVDPRHRGRGIGLAMVKFSERLSSGRGFALMTLHARGVVEPFYRSMGYITVGDSFEEVTLPHVAMEKSLV